MSSNKLQSCREAIDKKTCYGCRYSNHNGKCTINRKTECSVDGHYMYWEPNLKTCKKCVWSSNVGIKLFCVSVQGTCLRKEQIMRNAILNSRKDDRNGI